MCVLVMRSYACCMMLCEKEAKSPCCACVGCLLRLVSSRECSFFLSFLKPSLHLSDMQLLGARLMQVTIQRGSSNRSRMLVVDHLSPEEVGAGSGDWPGRGKQLRYIPSMHSSRQRHSAKSQPLKPVVSLLGSM